MGSKLLLAGQVYLVGWGAGLNLMAVGALPLLGCTTFMCKFVKFSCSSPDLMIATSYFMMLCGCCRLMAGVPVTHCVYSHTAQVAQKLLLLNRSDG